MPMKHRPEARTTQTGKHSLNEKTYHRVGWGLFIICAVFFIAAAIKNKDGLTLAGSIIFLIACALFLIPLGKKKDRSIH